MTLLAYLYLRRLARLDPRTAWFSAPPGGLAETSLVALAIGDDPALVAAVHIVRVALVVVAAPLLFRLLERRLPAAAS